MDMIYAPYHDVTVVSFESGGAHTKEDALIVETPLEVLVNGQGFVSLLCTPIDLEDLVIGFLYSEGIIASLEDIVELQIAPNRAEIRIKGEFENNGDRIPSLTSGCGRNFTWRGRQGDCIFEVKVDSPLKISAADVIRLMAELQGQGDLYWKTRGAHGAALASPQGILILREDIGRHNAVDKVAGWVLRQKEDSSNKILLTTGRISSEILYKTARMRIPVIVSLSVPSDYAVWLADLLGITVVGVARGRRFKVYSHSWRVFEGTPL